MTKRELAMGQLRRLARSRSNDGVKLAFLQEDALKALEGLDLAAVTEFKRSANGAVELKFIDRVALLEWLSEHSDTEQESGALFEALERNVERGEG